MAKGKQQEKPNGGNPPSTTKSDGMTLGTKITIGVSALAVITIFVLVVIFIIKKKK